MYLLNQPGHSTSNASWTEERSLLKAWQFAIIGTKQQCITFNKLLSPEHININRKIIAIYNPCQDEISFGTYSKTYLLFFYTIERGTYEQQCCETRVLK